MLAKEMKKELVKIFSFGKYQLAENAFQALKADVTKDFYNEVKNYLKSPRKVSPEILKKRPERQEDISESVSDYRKTMSEYIALLTEDEVHTPLTPELPTNVYNTVADFFEERQKTVKP